jgi:peroxiredoxin
MFNELQNEFSRRDFVILSFALDDNESIKEFIQKRPISFSVFASSKDAESNNMRQC